MPERKRLDLVEHLRLLVDEEAPLWEAPLQSNIVTEDAVIEYGPWSAQLCASVLLRWIEIELVGLYRCRPDPESVVALDHPEALAVAGNANQWPDRRNVFLHATTRGASVPDDVWRQAAGPVG